MFSPASLQQQQQQQQQNHAANSAAGASPLVLAEAWARITSPPPTKQQQQHNNTTSSPSIATASPSPSTIFSISKTVGDINNSDDDQQEKNDYSTITSSNNNNNNNKNRYMNFPVGSSRSNHHLHPAGHVQPPPSVTQEAEKYKRRETRARKRRERKVFDHLESGHSGILVSTPRSQRRRLQTNDHFLNYNDRIPHLATSEFLNYNLEFLI